MADKDNTSAEVKPEAPAEITEISSQETLEAALSKEPVKTDTPEETEAPEEKEELQKKDGEKIFGKYESLEEAQKAFVNVQAAKTKAEQKIKEIEKQMATKTASEIKGMEYDKQIEYLLGQIEELGEFKRNLLDQLGEANEQTAQQSEQQAINEFVGKHPLLKETGLDDEFRLIATHPSMQEYTLDSIYEVRIKPKLEKLMGTKISVKERKLVGTTNKPEENKFADVSNMSAKEYEKHRAQILASQGIH